MLPGKAVKKLVRGAAAPGSALRLLPREDGQSLVS